MENPWWIAALAYLVVSAGLFVYGANYYYFALGWWRLRRRPATTPRAPSTFPMVTVQLPVYNERYVVQRLVQAVAAFEWPRDRLEIQVLDDSDDDTPLLLEPVLADLRARGVDVVHVRRPTRDGYKAGALAYGLPRAKGEFLAIFDCDFVPPSDFLMRVMAEFEDPRVGLVQTRWGHLNRDFSRLTRAQAIGIDGHFAVEQEVRHRFGYLINFNGTAGVWRRACIEDAGGWTADTLAEDLDLSYRAQLRGWRCVYRKDVVCPAELPAQLQAFKRQQFRWAKGSMQVFRKLRKEVARSSLTRRQKVVAGLHLSLYMVHPLMLASFLVLPLVLLAGNFPMVVPAVFAVASLGPASMYVASQLELERGRWTRTILALPYLTVLGVGQCLNNSRAVFEGLLGRKSEFLRTPKFGIVGHDGGWRGSAYALRTSRQVLAELALAGYGVGVVAAAIWLQNWWTVPWAALFTAGFALVGTLTFIHARGLARGRQAGAHDADAA